MFRLCCPSDSYCVCCSLFTKELLKARSRIQAPLFTFRLIRVGPHCHVLTCVLPWLQNYPKYIHRLYRCNIDDRFLFEFMWKSHLYHHRILWLVQMKCSRVEVLVSGTEAHLFRRSRPSPLVCVRVQFAAFTPNTSWVWMYPKSTLHTVGFSSDECSRNTSGAVL